MNVRFKDGNTIHNIENIQVGVNTITLFMSCVGESMLKACGTYDVKDVSWITNSE